MKYKIKIEYRTGNSINSNDEIDYIDLQWEKLDVAKENLKRIAEHYRQYNDMTSYFSRRKKEDIFELNINKDWFVNVPKLISKINNCAIDEKDKMKIGEENCEYVPDDYYAQYCLKLKTDDGNDYQLCAFWCGHFERLYSAEIEIDSSDLKIMFN